MPTGDFPEPDGMIWTDACGYVPTPKSEPWMRVMTEWQSIETAPKDGSAILLYGGPLQVVGSWKEFVGGRGAWFGFYDGEPCIENPTHWMPLPAPPNA